MRFAEACSLVAGAAQRFRQRHHPERGFIGQAIRIGAHAGLFGYCPNNIELPLRDASGPGRLPDQSGCLCSARRSRVGVDM